MDHYTNLAAQYDEYYRYSDDYINYFTNKIVENLPIKNCETIVELGSGTGIFAKEILKRTSSVQMICVDNSALMLNKTKDERIKQICQDAIEFSGESIVYDRIYMKEFIHHIHNEGRLILFKGIYSQLKNDGSILILLEPRRLNYPLFDEALRRFENRQPSRLEIINDLESAGFSTSFSVISYPINLEKQKYTEMVRNRYMSVLESFTDDELENGITSINDSHKNDALEYLEIFYSIRGVKLITGKHNTHDVNDNKNRRDLL
ncbi:MAG TPA: class I SAM-dependent methyltransferase [Flavitalea sp.]|nr:class I SAM-dependent methyltransferase [Flavitalea sp.]